MRKTYIKIESGIRYFSQIKDFQFKNGILNKQLAGTGATTFALESNEPTIICSPRNELLRNKHEQYPNTLLVIGGVYQPEIVHYIENTDLPKILVSYDSLYKLLDCISDVSNWRIVVDEFQCLLSDSSFKSEVEFKFLENLKHFPNVTFLSATPILDKYLEQIDYFKDMDYYEMDWEDKEIIKVYRWKSPSPLSIAVQIVQNYQRGNYPFILKDGKQVKSTECVIFLNSVNNIANIIKQTKLSPDEVNIIVGNSEDNDKQIKKIGAGFERGRIPLKGERHKKFTFCTSTAYAGCDFYSLTATTFAISDCKRINTSIDIATELIQIAGRQRLDANPFRKYLFFIYNISTDTTTDEEFLSELDRKSQLSNKEIQYYNDAEDDLRAKLIKDNIRNQKALKYTESYTMYDQNRGRFVFNKLAYINEKYSFDVQKHNYENGVVIKKQLTDSGFDASENQEYKVYEEQLKHIIQKETFEERMKQYCEYRDKGDLFYDMTAMSLANQYPELKHYYDALGSKEIKAKSYKEANLRKELHNREMKSRVIHELSKCITIFPHRLTNKEAKALLQSIYDEIGMNKTATATQMEDYLSGNIRYNLKKDGQHAIEILRIH